MKTRVHPFAFIVLLAAAVVVFANSPSSKTTNAPPGTRDEIEKSFHVKPGGVLKFDADLADAEIITGDSDTVRIELIREFKVATAEEANALRQKLTLELGQVDVTTTGENSVKVTVRLADDLRGTNRRKIRLNFRITMPRKFNLELRTAGSATVGDLDGWAKARTEGGSLKLGNVSGEVTAKSEGGSVTIGNAGGNLEARSEGGSATIGRVNGLVVATAEGGSVSIEEATDAISARAEGGSVKAWISKQPHTDSKITAEAGNIDLRLHAAISVNVDAACTAGRLSSDFSVDGHQVDNPKRLKNAINGGGPLVLLRASAGNINLHK
jgi:hypothetical protein